MAEHQIEIKPIKKEPMRPKTAVLMVVAVFFATPMFVVTVSHAEGISDQPAQEQVVNQQRKSKTDHVQLGPWPFYLVQGMDEGKLKDRPMQCESGPFYPTDFSAGHHGPAMRFPEHSDVSRRA
jgi:glycerophosphoryl diester phosphodiesterase